MRANDNNGRKCSQRSLRMALRNQTGDRDSDDISPSLFVEKTNYMLDFQPCWVALWSALAVSETTGGMIDR